MQNTSFKKALKAVQVTRFSQLKYSSKNPYSHYRFSKHYFLEEMITELIQIQKIPINMNTALYTVNTEKISQTHMDQN